MSCDNGIKLKTKSDQYQKTDENEDKRKSLITNQIFFTQWRIFLTKIYNEFDFYKYLN